MNMREVLTRLGAVFAATAVPNLGVGAALDIAAWKSATMAGVVAVLAVLQRLAAAYRDGKLTAAEVDDAFDGTA